MLRTLQQEILNNGNPLIFTIDTSLSSGDDFTIPTDIGETYLYDVDWGDGNTDLGQTGDASHTYSTGGIYQITVSGTFPKFYFNDSGDKLKLTSIDQFGDVGWSITDQDRSFSGCRNLTSLADDIDFMNSLTNMTLTFYDCRGLTLLPDTLTLDSLVTCTQGFWNATFLEALPDDMLLDNLVSVNAMFRECRITTLPSGMTLSNLTNGSLMFLNNSLTGLPSGMVLDDLITATAMFRGNDITEIPSGSIWGNLVNAANMFLQNNETLIIPSSMTLASLSNGLNMFNGATIPTSDYSTLINNIDTNNANTGVTFHGGNSTYNSSAETAHDNLTITKSWSITDGGLV